jgi:protein involved in polysaccharide export with SLBB domain
LLIVGVAAGLPAAGQTPSAQQLQLLQNLSPAEREAILQQLGATPGAKTPSNDAQSGANQIIVERPPSQANANGLATAESGSLPQRPPTIHGGEWILIDVALPKANTPRKLEEQTKLEEMRDRILKRNPFELTSEGILQLPGVDLIALAGLTEKQIQQRLLLDPALRQFTIIVTMLRIEPQGASALKPFGYELFHAAATALVPGTDIPVPDDYKVGPGDTVSVQLFGQTSQVLTLPVGRDGSISFPQLGPINVAGLDFSAARNAIEGRVRKQMLGTQARVSLTELRSARVLVLGDAERPGSYVLSGLATATTALFASGGVKPIGSLRAIEVKRGGALVRRLDVYDVLLKGDTTNDVRLQPGDAVFVPPVGATVGIDGAIRRPAIYELLRERTVADLISIAGGVAPDADLKSATLERIEGGKDRRVQSLDLENADGRSVVLQAGDLIRIRSIRPLLDNEVTVEGHVYRPGSFAYVEGLRISDVITSVDDLKPRADTHYLLVRRRDPLTQHVSVFSADLQAALENRHAAADLPLMPRDRISVFDLTTPRDRVVEPLLEEIGRQARPEAPTQTVSVGGRVNAEGRYPLEPGMRVSDLIRAGGGLDDTAYETTAELTRYEIVNGDRRHAELHVVDLAAIKRGDAQANMALQPYDVLTIKQVSEWGRIEEVELVGEVRFPGNYRIRRGESLRSLMERAGGLTPLAFPQGAVFTREELKTREREQLDRLADRLEAEIASLSLQASQSATPAAAESLAAGQGLLQQLRNAKPVGRLVIDLARIGKDRSGGTGDVTLRGGDRLLVPRQTEEVTVLGEVQNPTSHLYHPGLKRDDLISLSGGFTARADKKRAYVVRADGSVSAPPSHWLGSGNVDVAAGDSVVVPFDAEKMRPLPLWTAVTTILYNLAIAATAIGRL